MQDKSKFDELLISYLSNELNQEDEEFVLKWINFNGQNREYFEEFATVWKILGVKNTIDNIDVNNEWKHFKRTVNNKQQETYLLKEVESIFSDSVAEDEKPKTKAPLHKIIISTAIAASITLGIGFTSGLFRNHKPIEPSLASVSIEKTEALPAFVRHQKNTSGKPKRIILKDGSEVILSNKSEVSYHEPFTGNTRDITLKGGAYFKVTKDKTKPFVVFSGDISTTVLGTRFTVTAFENAHNISIRLYQGRVVVKPVAGVKKKLINNFYLLPGQELIYNNISSTARLRKFRADNINTVRVNNSGNINQENDVPAIPFNEKGSWYMFNNQSLEQVFKLLENMYDVRILYSKSSVHNRYFIGKFEKSDSVENVLKQIAALNNLKLTKKNNKFIISK
jgi:hypothetical protein